MAGSVCEHEANGAHFGHHLHKHDVPTHDASGDAEQDGDPFGSHPDCEACHGFGAGVLTALATVSPAWDDTAHVPRYGRHLPEPPVESLLRPPLTLVA